MVVRCPAPAPHVTAARRASPLPLLRVHPGVQVTVSNLGIGRNPALWGEDADEFRPERWFERAEVEEQRLAVTESNRKPTRLLAYSVAPPPRQ